MQESFSRIYPAIFELLWHSMPTCTASKDNPDSPHMLSKCSWKGEKVNCSDIFTPVITDSGVCCAFNLQDNLRDSDYSRLVHTMQEESKGPSEEKIRTVVSGIGRGLEVVLDQNSDRSSAANTDIVAFSEPATNLSSHGSPASVCSSASLPSSHFFREVICCSNRALATLSRCLRDKS